MPNRIVREAILSSEKVAALGWPEEVFYRRLMSVVDDYGRTEANPQLLRSKCYPLQTDAVRAADISRWMAACQKAGLILCYAVVGKQYLEVLNFGQQQRSASKFPQAPADAINGNHLPADAHLDVVVVGGVAGISSDLLPESEQPPSEFSIPLIDGTDYQVPAKLVDEWKATYLAVDVPQELREMRAWSLANKTKRKTRRGIESFIVKWLGKAQDTPSRAGQRPAADDWTGRAT